MPYMERTQYYNLGSFLLKTLTWSDQFVQCEILSSIHTWVCPVSPQITIKYISSHAHSGVSVWVEWYLLAQIGRSVLQLSRWKASSAPHYRYTALPPPLHPLQDWLPLNSGGCTREDKSANRERAMSRRSDIRWGWCIYVLGRPGICVLGRPGICVLGRPDCYRLSKCRGLTLLLFQGSTSPL